MRSPTSSRPCRTGSPGSGTSSAPASGDRRGGKPRLVGGEPAELDRGGDAVTGGPGPRRVLHASVVAGEDEALLVGRKAVDPRADDPRDREDALDVEALAAGLERQAAVPARATTPVLSSTPASRSSSATAGVASRRTARAARARA